MIWKSSYEFNEFVELGELGSLSEGLEHNIEPFNYLSARNVFDNSSNSMNSKLYKLDLLAAKISWFSGTLFKKPSRSTSSAMRLALLIISE